MAEITNNLNHSSGDGAAPPGKGIMVCVTGQRSCERLILRGADHKHENDRLYIVHCVQTGHNFMNTVNEADAIEYLFTASRLVGAELTVLREDDVLSGLVSFAKAHDIDLIVLGESPESSSESFVAKLNFRLPNADFDVVGSRG